jgi:hypothetical protein
MLADSITVAFGAFRSTGNLRASYAVRRARGRGSHGSRAYNALSPLLALGRPDRGRLPPRIKAPGGFNPADFTTAAFSVNRTFIRQKLVDMINEQISHLTSDRTEQQDEKFDAPEWLETANAIEKEFQRWVANLKPEWVHKWEQRERMNEAAKLELKIDGHFGGGCTAPTMITGPTGPPPPPNPRK